MIMWLEGIYTLTSNKLEHKSNWITVLKTCSLHAGLKLQFYVHNSTLSYAGSI
jgi:hypothetical protein